MRSRALMIAIIAVTISGVEQRLVAQAPPAQLPGAQVLRMRLDSVFLDRARSELGLMPAQVPGLERVVKQWAERRITLENEERKLRGALNGQLQPGVAARPARLNQVLDALNENRVRYASSFRDEMSDLAAVLTPVQRGRFQLLRDGLQQKVRNAQQGRPPLENPAIRPAGRAGGPNVGGRIGRRH